MNRGVVYIITNPPHAARLVVSLASLRKHYDGPVTIYVTQELSRQLVARVAAEPRIGGIEVRDFDHAKFRRNSTYLTKVALFNSDLPYESTVFLDADTLIVDGFSTMFYEAEAHEICLTQFSNWSSAQGVIRRRIERWSSMPQAAIPQEEFRDRIKRCVSGDRAAINVGILAIRRGAAVLPHWLTWAGAGWQTFIPDEISMQIIYRDYPHSVVKDRYNYSPLYGCNFPCAIWHFHGDKHLLDTQRNPAGKDGGMWGRAFIEAYESNLAGVAEWWDKCGDVALNNWLPTRLDKA